MPSVTPPISEFRGEFLFLSNFYPSPLTYEGEEYATAEHAYQAAKCEDDIQHERIKLCETPALAKKMGRRVKLVHDWEEIKLRVMRDILWAKFAYNVELATKLLETKQRKLIEGNWWGDTFWGVCKGRGENHLGKLLMLVRDRIREQIERSLICRR